MLSRQQLKGLTTVTAGDLVYISATSGSLAVLADVAVGQVLTSGGVGTVPAFSAAPVLNTSVTVGDSSTQDRIIIQGIAKGAGQFDGTLSTIDLTGARAWNLPNESGTILTSVSGQPLDATLTALAGLTIADVSIIEGTGADAFNVVASGGNNYILGSNSSNTALEFKAPTGSGSPVLGTSPTINLSGGGSIQVPEKTPVNAVAAQGTITMSGIAIANETFVVSTQTFTWKATRTGAGEVTIGASASEAVTNIVTAITTDLATVTAVDGAGDTVVVTAVTKGTSGNSIPFTEASTNMAVDGANFLGGTTTGVDGTLGIANETCADATYLYHAIAANTVADTNWRRIALGSAY